MHNFKWTVETEIILYGASGYGHRFYTYLHEQCNIISFLDKRADEIRYFIGLPVYDIASVPYDEKKKRSVLVIISVKNVFDHDNIARHLFSHGFVNILYRSSPQKLEKFAELNKISEIYNDVFTNQDLFFPIEIPVTEPMAFYEKKDCGLISQHNDQIIALIPPLFISTNKRKGKSKCIDIPLLSFYPNIDLYKYYDGDPHANINCYLDHYRPITGVYDTIGVYTSQRWQENIVSSRGMGHEQMSLSYDLDPDFFIRNAAPAVWNTLGYFNLTDGKNRSSFLLSRGKRFIPLKVSINDYQSFLSESVANSLISYLETEQMNEVPFPILNPYFYRFPCANSAAYHMLLHKLARWLGEYSFQKFDAMCLGKITILNKSVTFHYLAQSLAKLGCSVDTIIANTPLLEILNNLYYSQKGVRNVSKYKIDDYDLILCDDGDNSLSHHQHCLFLSQCQCAEGEQMLARLLLNDMYYNVILR